MAERCRISILHSMTTETYKLIDSDHPELFWLLETSPASAERFFFEYNFENIVKGWFFVVPKYLFKRKGISYRALYYTREQAEAAKVDTNFAVVELLWEPVENPSD
jgi:hypothetical protein